MLNISFLPFVLVLLLGSQPSPTPKSGDTQAAHQQDAANRQSPDPSVTASIDTKGVGVANNSNGPTANNSEVKITDWIAVATNLGILIAIIVQACIYNRQRVLMWRQWIAMRKSIAQTKAQTKILGDSFRFNSRAYVFIGDAKLRAAISSGDYPEPYVYITNFGKTPAYQYRMRFHHGFLTGEDDKKARQGIMPPMTPLGKQGHALGPGADATIHGPELKQTWKDHEEREDAMRGLATYHIWGLICYVDVFGDEHAYKFSLYAKNQTVTHLSWGRFGNDAEEKGCEAAQASN